jgi:hypothetical protein
VVRVYIDSSAEGDADVTFAIQNSNNAPALSTVANNISSRSFLATTVAWTASLAAGWQDSPSLHTLVQEVVDLAGWAEGNSILFRLVDPDGGFEFRQYDHPTAGTYAARLLITYDLP